MPRVVLLGASNLAIALPLVVRRLAAGLPKPLDLYIACGHGRSYCDWSRVLFRGLPGIDDCGLWEGLRSADSAPPTLALLTDVGNDLLYGAAPAEIAERVERCVDRLAGCDAEVVVTRLPLASVERLSPLRFHATKAFFFPGSGGDWPTMLANVRELDRRLDAMAGRGGVIVRDQPGEWYGFDPIHIRRGIRDEAWTSLFRAWSIYRDDGRPPRLGWRDHFGIRLAAPSERRLFGRTSRRAQPAHTMDDVRVHLY